MVDRRILHIKGWMREEMASSPFPGHMWVVTSKLAWKMRIITQVVAIGTGGVSQGVMVVAALLVTTNS